MKILMVNSVCGFGSTGRICTDIAEALSQQAHEVKIAYGREAVHEKYQKYAVKIGNSIDQNLHWLRTRLMNEHGFGSRKATRNFLQWANEYNPDLLWLHNIHGYYINVEMLFDWIKSRPQMKIKWTLHDCWAFTGHCTYFTVAKCTKWKTHCSHCPQVQRYPASYLFDNSKRNFERKRRAFTGVADMTLITPSQWLADLVKQSFLKEYPVKVEYNKINTTVFKPTPNDFRERYGLQDKKIILGVASIWSPRKGLDDLIKLSQMLDESYAVVLVGLTPKQIKSLPHGILGLTRTNSVQALAEIYTAADLFVNCTYEDNFPTVNLESLACGTPVITYRTGGSPEALNERCGIIVDQGDLSALVQAIKEYKGDTEACLLRVRNFALNSEGLKPSALYEV